MGIIWHKETLITSNIDSTLEILHNYKQTYFLELKHEVIGRGFSDDNWVDKDGVGHRWYNLRRLVYKNKVILEQMIQTWSIDQPDRLESHEFEFEDEPENWNYIIPLTPPSDLWK